MTNISHPGFWGPAKNKQFVIRNGEMFETTTTLKIGSETKKKKKKKKNNCVLI